MKTDYAYLAGIIDGEGCFLFYRAFNKVRISTGMKRYLVYYPALIISNCDIELMEWIRSMGFSKPHRRYYKDKVRRVGYTAGIYSNGLRKLLPLILPYLKVKKEHAELFLEYLKVVKQKSGKQYSVLSKEDWEYREKLYNRIKHLNRRGAKNYL